jgi:hypothetical protein
MSSDSPGVFDGIDRNESIRQRIVSLLADASAVKRKFNRFVSRRETITDDEATIFITEFKGITRRMDQETRELYYLLPADLRTGELPLPAFPNDIRHGELIDDPDGSAVREPSELHAGPPLPRRVRWPKWTVKAILALADAYYEKHGRWPTSDSGRVSETSADTWAGLDLAARRGNRGMLGGSSLPQILLDHRGVRTTAALPDLSVDTIVKWAENHHARTRKWPNMRSGPVFEAPDETWGAIGHAIIRGTRGLALEPKSMTLASLLADHCGAPYTRRRKPLTVNDILAWADSHHCRTGSWPTRNSGDIPEASGENWGTIDEALIHGRRSLPPRWSLAKLLSAHREVRNRKALPKLKVDEVLRWAHSHFARHGRWPTCWSGPVDDAPGETWLAVDAAFKSGGRGLKGCGYPSLSRFLDEEVGPLIRHGARPAERIRKPPNDA